VSARSHATPIRALVVEDSTAARRQVVRILQAEGDLDVVGQAASSLEAVRLAHELRPDVVILDPQLPDGGGRRAVEQIMATVPTPTLLLSRDPRHVRSASVVEALAAGALEAVPRPERWTPELEAQLRRSVRVLSKVHVIRHVRGGHQVADPAPSGGPRGGPAVIAIAASTGGPSALAIVLSGLAAIQAPVLVVQHLHPDFTGGLVDWMSRVSALPVRFAEDGETARGGQVYLAPSGRHLRLAAGSRLVLDVSPVTVHRPSADQLFTSVARHAGTDAIGVLLTGMGDDGARGLLAIHEHGGRTLAQDEASCAVFGMPAAARRLGAVTEMLPPADLARVIAHASRERVR
jgi:two-component system chemotaxis response regulator CheB